MIIEKAIMKTEAIFSENKEHRYILKKEWDKTKKRALVIMQNPNTASELVIDHTTMFVINNLVELGYGGVEIQNIFTKRGNKLKLGVPMEELVDRPTADEYISKGAEKADVIIVAWGAGAQNSKRIMERELQMQKLLLGVKDKVFQITEKALHPLCPHAKKWNLVKAEYLFSIEETVNLTNKEEA